MLNFDINLLRSVYVYIIKVTTDYVYVTTTRSGEPYRKNSSPQDTYKGYNVSKIKIHRSISSAYSSFYPSREFAEPRLASFNMYGDTIVSIEAQMFNRRVNGYQLSSNWQSFFSQTIKLLETELANEAEVWINGTEIFWMIETTIIAHDGEHLNSPHDWKAPKKESDPFTRKGFNELFLNADKNLSIREVKFVKLSGMGLSVLSALNNQKEIEAINNDDEEALKSIINDSFLRVSSGNVLTFYPNAGYDTLDSIAVFSPVLQQKKLGSSKIAVMSSDEEKKVYNLASKTNQAYGNIDFAIKAANTIGKLYGYEHTDDLNIQDIILDTGEVNLLNIDEVSRKKTPIKMDALTCLAFLFRFIYKEKNMTNMLELSKMFKFCINKGIVYTSDIDYTFVQGVDSIPLSPLSKSHKKAS